MKYYHEEAGTAAVSRIFAELGRKIQISTLGLVETQAAFAMKVAHALMRPVYGRAYYGRGYRIAPRYHGYRYSYYGRYRR